MAFYDSDELIQTLKTRGLIPTINTAWAASDFLKALSDEIDTTITPLLVKARSGHILTTVDIPLVSGQTAYRLPARAFANGVYNVELFDSSGNWTEIPHRDVSALSRVGANKTFTGDPQHYWEQGAYLYIYPTPQASTTWTIRVWYHYKPSRLVGTATVLPIGNITTGSKQVSLTLVGSPAMPSPAFAVTDADGKPVKYDFVKGSPPFDILAFDQTATTVSFGGQFAQMTNTLPVDLAQGDYLCFAGQTPIPNVPEILHPTIAVLAAAVALRSIGDHAGAEAQARAAEKMLVGAISTLAPRSRGNARRAVQRRIL